jgi:hypothetical protein
MAVEGQIKHVEAELLFNLAAAVPADRVIVEIGSYRGRSSVALGLGSMHGHGAKVIAIDPHDAFVGPRGGTFGPTDQAARYRNMTDAGVGEVVSIVCLRSSIVSAGCRDRNVGLLWLDGDHQYEGLKADVEGWSPHLADDATIAFHDDQYPDVVRLLDELVAAGRMTFRGKVWAISYFRVGPTKPGPADSGHPPPG